MFERYGERARRVLFFSRYEAAQAGLPSIEPEHLVLGVLREWRRILKFARAGETGDSIRARLESGIIPREPVSTSVEIPFSPSCKEVLTQTAAEADALKNATIRPEHFIVAIMTGTNGVAARALRDAGVDPDAIREFLRDVVEDPADRPGAKGAPRVVRQWTGVVKPGLAEQYVRYLREETFEVLHDLSGFAHMTIMRRDVEDGTEFQVTTYWQSLDAIKAFAGDDVTRAVVPPPAQALMVRYDERAVHYDIVS